MKKYKYIIFFVLSLFLIQNSYALDDAIAYISFDNNYEDITGNGNDFINSGTILSNFSILKNSASADGLNDYISTPDFDNVLNYDKNWTLSFWAYRDSSDGNTNLFSGSDGGSGTVQFTISQTTLKITNSADSSSDYRVNYAALNDQFNHFVIMWDSSNRDMKLYRNNILIGIDGSGGYSDYYPNNNPRFFNLNGLNQYMKGYIDEVGIWDRELTTSEINELNNNGTGYNPFRAGFTNNLNQWYNTSNFTINISFISSWQEEDIGYKLNDNVSFSEYIPNTTGLDSVLFNVTNLNEQNYNISFFSSGENLLNYSFGVDLTDPTISINLTEFNDFEVNFDEIIIFEDNFSGVNTCTIELIYLENITNSSQYNDNINCDETKVFEVVGRYNATVTVTDNAGNIKKQTYQKLIKPYLFINFLDENDNNISNYDGTLYRADGSILQYVNKNNPINVSPYHDNGLDLGNYTFEFRKDNYVTSNFTFNINASSGGNTINFNVNNATINLKVFNLIDNQLIEDSISISLIPSSFNTTFTGGQINISGLNLQENSFQIIATTQDFETETIFFTYDKRSYLEQIIYMLPKNETNKGTLIVELEDSTSKLSGQLVNLLAWSNSESAFVTVGQSKTNSNGRVFFNVELNNKLYKATSTLNGQTITSPEQIIRNDNDLIILTFNDIFEQFPIKTNITYNLINLSHNLTHELFTFTFIDNNNIVNDFCLEARKQIISSSALIDKRCVTTNSGEISFYVPINNSYSTVVRAYANLDSGIINLDSILIKSIGTFENGLGRELSIFFILASFVITVGLAVTIQSVSLISILTIINSWVVYSLFSSTLPFIAPFLITLIMGGVMYATFKKRF